MAYTLCTSGAAKAAAGINANTSAISGTDYDTFSDDVENEICGIVNYDVITNFSSLTSGARRIISRLAAKKIGQDILNYDVTGYQVGEAQLIMDKLENDATKIVDTIKEAKTKTFLGIASG